MRIFFYIIIFIGAVLLGASSISDHPMAHDFLSRIAFEMGYKLLVLFSLYMLAREFLDIRRHELIELVKKGSREHVMIYCTWALCITLVLAFVS